MEKICSLCRTKYPKIEGNFSSNGSTPAGKKRYRSSCKACEKHRDKQVRATNLPLKDKRNETRRMKRLLEGKKKDLTELAYCQGCGKLFVVTILPEKCASITLTCKGCLNPAQQENLKEN